MTVGQIVDRLDKLRRESHEMAEALVKAGHDPSFYFGLETGYDVSRATLKLFGRHLQEIFPE